MAQNFSLKVEIKEDLKKGLIFGIKSRPAIGSILSFSGYKHQIMPQLQKISHSERAFLLNANGLPGFIKGFEIFKTLTNADENGLLEETKKWQEIDIALLKKNFETK